MRENGVLRGHITHVACLCALIFALSSCGPRRPLTSHDEASQADAPAWRGDPCSGEMADICDRVRQATSIEFEESMTDEHQRAFYKDLHIPFERELRNFGVTSDEQRMLGYAETLFEGTEAKDILSFLDDRIRIILPPAFDWESKVTTSVPSTASINANVNPMMAAANIGMALWVSGLSSQQTIHMQLNGRSVTLTDPHEGIVLLGNHFRRNEQPLDEGSLRRLGTIVHEARHSDCTNGMSRKTLEELELRVSPKIQACGHLHATCPRDHLYFGMKACEEHAWGAYAVDALYFYLYAKLCTNCSEREKSGALMAYFDSRSRIIPEKFRNELFLGEHGKPEVNHLPVIID